ncbi:hypothetical protein Tco_0902426 [Tanacetum coccineum]
MIGMSHLKEEKSMCEGCPTIVEVEANRKLSRMWKEVKWERADLALPEVERHIEVYIEFDFEAKYHRGKANFDVVNRGKEEGVKPRSDFQARFNDNLI